MSQHRIYSCDDHLDMNAVPPELWQERVAAKFRDAVPKVVDLNGQKTWIAGGRPFGVSGRYAGAIQSAIERGGVVDDGFRASNPKLRLEDMQRDGIWASIVYGPSSLFRYPISDPEASQAAIRAWNDWAAECFNSHAPERLSALPELPMDSAEIAAAELQRVARLGHRGAGINGYSVDLADKSWEPLWSVAEEVGLPISFHIGGGTRLDPRKGGYTIAAFAAIAPMQLDEVLSVLIFAGVLERHPKLRIVLAESGVGWVPYFVARMDATFDKHCAPHPQYSIKTKPSELFRRQVFATFEEEPLGPALIPLLGPDNFMWACDYPHPDSTWPESRKAIDHALGSLGEEAIRKITGENCRQLYRLP
jgi:predicted TIM-barrel fold metal-dependent hydrolase